MNTCAPLEIASKLDLSKITKRILNTSTVAWNNRVTQTSLNKWLDNFTGEALGCPEDERALAAWLLMNFTYYTVSEVEEMCRILFQKFIHSKLQNPVYQASSDSIPVKIRKILSRTVFTNLGDPSESGSFILYAFRTCNNLSKDVFTTPGKWNELIANGTIDDIVLIDDVTISGTQAIEYLKLLPNTGSSITTTLLTFFATPDALHNLSTRAPGTALDYVNLLDERTRLFSDSSFVFCNNNCKELKESAYKLCLHYGKKLVENELSGPRNYMVHWPLGFANGQQTFAFYYNTPDNTLPIFWCKSPNWSAIFPRHHKLYNVEEVEISDAQYW